MSLKIREMPEASGGVLGIEAHGPIGEDFYGDGITARGMSALMAQHPGAPVMLYVSSPGGDALEGATLRAMLSSSGRKVSATIEGVAASAAGLMIMAASDIAIHADAAFMLHEVRVGAFGDAAEIARAAAMQETLNTGYAEVYAARSGHSVTKIRKMMADTAWFSGAEAVAAGFATRAIAPLVKAAARFDLSMYANVPENLQAKNSSVRGVNMLSAEILKRLGLPADATEEQALAALDARNASQVTPPAPAAPPPAASAAAPLSAADVAAVVTSVLDARAAAAPPVSVAEIHATAVAACVERHIDARKISPAGRAAAIAACGTTAAQLAACDAYWQAAATVVAAAPAVLGSTPPAVTGGAIMSLNPAQAQICADMGLDPVKYLATLNSKPALVAPIGVK